MHATRLLAVLASAAMLAAPIAARADIYTWVDDAGRLNVSNLPPPEDVAAKVTASVSRPQPRSEAELQREVAALAERVRRLEGDVQAIAGVAPPPVPAPVAVVPVPQYVPVPVFAPAPALEPIGPAPPSCNPTWAGCYGSWGVAPVPTIVVVQPVPRRPPPRAPRAPFAAPHVVRAVLR